ncbi:MAG: flagellar biosynthesis protein FlhF [Desulfobulbus sp.]|jgi:flagellar biosynthesis protein FlhF|uniref:flagellar biosynthesis protein FlhF n=1 Tax=Desulfobulbus sp. TaxID=895 RepID=UPI00283AD1A9|nr:flagellar biosynthesis protein FlhF [Desulfobulbus sp.]MDR2550754.1 flagellar biosynthesis protein FlhF [Desulfobulbus sp.]
MQVKVFEAKDMATGLKMVKEALGPDALILSTRTIRNGSFGVLGKPTMEITAAVDNNWREPEPESQASRTTGYARAVRSRERKAAPQPELTYEELWRREEPEPQPSLSYGPKNMPPAGPQVSVAGNPPPADQDVQSELAELRSLVKGLANRVSGLDAPALRSPYVEPEFTAPAGQAAPMDPVTGLLTGYGINQETAQVVARFTRETIDNARQLDGAGLTAILRTAIARLFSTVRVLDNRPSGQRRIALVGPTGVGKTTTLAKIAAHYLSRHGGRIGLITIDTYRIAAVEQLKVYGEIMRLPLEVVITPQELEAALDKFRDVDLVLIDTAGRSPKNGLEIQELSAFLRPELGIENHLLLSATTRERELEETIRRFSVLPISNFIFSKIDECDQLGVLLNIHYKNDTPISFLTNGQRVPEDLLMPAPADVAALILNDHGSLKHG